MKKTFISLLLAVASFATFAFPSFAVDENTDGLVERVRSLSETTIEEDFDFLKDVDGNNFNEADYPKVLGAEPRLLTIVEDCKLLDSESHYDLYFYIYIPDSVTYDHWNSRPFVQISFDGNSYYKFGGVRFGDPGTGPYFIISEDFRFAKFKVSLSEVYWKKLDKNKRSVYFSGFEFSQRTSGRGKVHYSPSLYFNNSAAFDSTSSFSDGIGRSDKAIEFRFEGNNPSRLVKAVGIDALQLDLFATYYRATNENSPEGEMNQLNTLYFTIPKRYFNEYGMISEAHYEYTKYTHVPFFVSNFNIFKPDFDLPVFYFNYDTIGAYGTSWRSNLTLVVGSDYVPKPDKDGILPLPFGLQIYQPQFVEMMPEDVNKFFSFSETSGDLSCGYLKRSDLRVSSEDLLSYYEDHEELLSDFVGKYVNKNVSSNDEDDFLVSDSYVSSSNFWQKLTDYGLAGLFLQDDSFNVSPIVLVDENDIDEEIMSDSVFSEKYRIDKSEVTKVRQAAIRAKTNDCRLVLIRFDVTTSYSCDVTNFAYQLDDNAWFTQPISGAKDIYDGLPLPLGQANKVPTSRMIYTENAVYLGIDVLDFTFKNDQGKYCIPVVANPIDYIAPTQKPEDIKDKLGIGNTGTADYTALIILAIVIVAVIAVTPHVSSFAGKIFGGPADRLVKSLKNRRGRNNRRR